MSTEFEHLFDKVDEDVLIDDFDLGQVDDKSDLVFLGFHLVVFDVFYESIKAFTDQFFN